MTIFNSKEASGLTGHGDLMSRRPFKFEAKAGQIEVEFPERTFHYLHRVGHEVSLGCTNGHLVLASAFVRGPLDTPTRRFCRSWPRSHSAVSRVYFEQEPSRGIVGSQRRSDYTNITDIRLGHERNKPICIICPVGINSPLKVATNEVIHWMNVGGRETRES